MEKKQDDRYNARFNGVLFNRATGETIPDDEPIFILRARDKMAIDAITYYAKLFDISNPHRRAVVMKAKAFAEFAERNPHRMKVPDTLVDRGGYNGS